MLEKIIIGFVLSLITITGCYVAYDHIKETGRKEVRAEWDKANLEALKQRNKDIEKAKAEQANINKKVIADYEAKLKTLDDKYRAAQSVGLRLSKNACVRPSTNTQSDSAGISDEAESIRLPERIESGLFALARRADEVSIQLESCQRWIKDNGFYPAQ